MVTLKRKLLLNLKNIPGWSTRRKIVVFSVDDYGNIRIASKQARMALQNSGLNTEGNRFDRYDALETHEDLSQLFDTLTSVKDSNGEYARFTAFALPANINFDAMAENGYQNYCYETLPETFSKLPGYERTWALWQEGIRNKLLMPEFHGREHVNIKILMHLLKSQAPDIMACFKNRSYGAISSKPFRNISYVAAFEFDDFQENRFLETVVADGLNVFEKVFGFRALHFNAPGAREHHYLERILHEGGIRFIDTDMIKNEHQGNGKFSRQYHYLGQQNKFGQTFIIRNCVFEPLLNPSKDWVSDCLAQIAIAFRWNKPANISSHRVNFAGHIEPKVREIGLKKLRTLLQEIIKRWPDVEFMTSSELGHVIQKEKSAS